MTTEEELVAAHAVYKATLAQAKAIARQETKARITELTREALVDLSKKVHSAHSSGMTKATINALLGVYSNVAQARPIWDAYSPEKKTDLRIRNASDSGDPIPEVKVVREGDELIVSLEHQEVTVIGARLLRDGDDKWVVWDEPGVAGNIALGGDYGAVYLAVSDFLKREEANEGGAL